MTSNDEMRERYAPQIRIAGIGEAGQERLASARVLVVGLGGLGSPAAYYLAAAGVGVLGLLDSDAVELSNLQRQILHTTARIGKPKVDSAAEALTALNPDLRIEPYRVRLTEENGAAILDGFDVVVEATDNFPAKFLVNDACLKLRKPFVTAGAVAVSGQVLFVVPGRTPCLRCVLPEPPENPPTMAQLGVLGATPGLLGTIEAFEVVRWIAGLWRKRSDGAGALHSVDGETMHIRTVRVYRRQDCRCASCWD